MERGQGSKRAHEADLSTLLGRRDLRSADRANMETMLADVRSGKSLSVQQIENLWAYRNRYLYARGRG